MAMLRIRRGKDHFKVSAKMFENVYKPMGYRIEGKTDGKSDGLGEGMEELFDIPISDMNKEQLQEFAKSKGIDTSSARSVSEARKIIQKAVRDSKM